MTKQMLEEMFVGKKVRITTSYFHPRTEKEDVDECECLAIEQNQEVGNRFDIVLTNRKRLSFVPDTLGDNFCISQKDESCFLLRKIEVIAVWRYL